MFEFKSLLVLAARSSDGCAEDLTSSTGSFFSLKNLKNKITKLVASTKFVNTRMKSVEHSEEVITSAINKMKMLIHQHNTYMYLLGGVAAHEK